MLLNAFLANKTQSDSGCITRQEFDLLNHITDVQNIIRPFIKEGDIWVNANGSCEYNISEFTSMGVEIMNIFGSIDAFWNYLKFVLDITPTDYFLSAYPLVTTNSLGDIQEKHFSVPTMPITYAPTFRDCFSCPEEVRVNNIKAVSGGMYRAADYLQDLYPARSDIIIILNKSITYDRVVGFARVELTDDEYEEITQASVYYKMSGDSIDWNNICNNMIKERKTIMEMI